MKSSNCRLRNWHLFGVRYPLSRMAATNLSFSFSPLKRMEPRRYRYNRVFSGAVIGKLPTEFVISSTFLSFSCYHAKRNESIVLTLMSKLSLFSVSVVTMRNTADIMKKPRSLRKRGRNQRLPRRLISMIRILANCYIPHQKVVPWINS